MARDVLVRPPSTSWMSVLGGWIATIGAMALVAPAVAGILARVNLTGGDLAPAVPVVIGIFVSYLIGGYVAGRMAGYRTSWHGMMTAFFSLFLRPSEGKVASGSNPVRKPLSAATARSSARTH